MSGQTPPPSRTTLAVSVATAADVEKAISGGADCLELCAGDSAYPAAADLPPIADLVAAVAGRRPTSAAMLLESVTGAEEAVAALAATGVNCIRVVLPGPALLGDLGALPAAAQPARLIRVFQVDREAADEGLLPTLASAGFAGVMLETSGDATWLLRHCDLPALARFAGTAQAQGLAVGFAGALEEPDVPRLLELSPDFLVFRATLRSAGDPRARLNPELLAAIRRLVPPEGEPGAPAAAVISQRIFVCDLVLPVRIGAYSHERESPQNVRFDVSVEVEPGRPGAEAMDQVLSYDVITDGIARLVAQGHIGLVETLAERIGAMVLRHPRARTVTVTVEKLDLGPGGVGVEIVMSRPGSGAPA